MNRQMRRITEKSEKKKEKEKAEKIAARRAKVSARRESRQGAVRTSASSTASTPGTAPAPAPTRPRNRFIGVLALINVMVVVYGAFLAPGEPTPTESLMNGLLYLTLGYFVSRWFLGRGFGGRALLYSVLAGAALALGLEVVKYALEGLQPNLLNLAFVLPALLLGAFGGVFIDRKLHGS